LGEQVNGEKSRIPKGFTADTIDLEMALMLRAAARSGHASEAASRSWRDRQRIWPLPPT
jgi:hypothetical protein